MLEQDSVADNEIVRGFVAEISKIPYVNTIASVKSAKGEPMIYTLVPVDTGRRIIDVVEDVVLVWAPIVEKYSGRLESVGIKVGPVFSAGQFKEFIEGSGNLRESQLLYDSSVV